MTSDQDTTALIDTLLHHFARSGVPFEGSVHLHCTDDDLEAGTGEWLIRGADGEVILSREHAKGEAAMRGPAEALLAVLRGEAALSTIDVVGDQAAAERLLNALP